MEKITSGMTYLDVALDNLEELELDSRNTAKDLIDEHCVIGTFPILDMPLPNRCYANDHTITCTECWSKLITKEHIYRLNHRTIDNFFHKRTPINTAESEYRVVQIRVLKTPFGTFWKYTPFELIKPGNIFRFVNDNPKQLYRATSHAFSISDNGNYKIHADLL